VSTLCLYHLGTGLQTYIMIKSCSWHGMRHGGTIAHLKQNKTECTLGHRSAFWVMVNSTIMRKWK